MNLKRLFRGPIIYILIAIVVVWIGTSWLMGSSVKAVTTQQGLEFLATDQVASAKIIDGEQRVDLTLKSADATYGQNVQFYYVAPRGPDVVKAVDAANLAEYNDEVPQQNVFMSLLLTLVPFVIIGVIFYFLLSRMQGGGGRVMQFGKSRAKLVGKEAPKVTFADVAGSDEAVEELEEIKDFLKEAQ